MEILEILEGLFYGVVGLGVMVALLGTLVQWFLWSINWLW